MGIVAKVLRVAQKMRATKGSQGIRVRSGGVRSKLVRGEEWNVVKCCELCNRSMGIVAKVL
jgi:hypothetical protein